jgi:hypothetical protein
MLARASLRLKTIQLFSMQAHAADPLFHGKNSM